MTNEQIRTASKQKRVKLWEIADHLNISESTLIRKLRHELCDSERNNILEIIDQIEKARA